MENDFVPVISYLTDEELQMVKKLFDQQKIGYIVKQHGPHIGQYYSVYYEINVTPHDFGSAKRIVEKFKASKFAEKQKCPKCGSSAYESRKLSFLQKIFYTGTKPVQCRRCKTKFVV